MRHGAVTFAQGFCMGAADVIPGVSGGTVAFILGIYQRLMEAIRAFDGEFLRYFVRRDFGAASRHADMGFLVPLGLGILAALIFFTRVLSLPTLIREQPVLIYSLFFGLILASIALLLRVAGPLRLAEGALVCAGMLAGFLVVTTVPMETPDAAWFLALSGGLAICAMLLPGVSGAFTLLILRKYEYVLGAVGNLELGIIVPFAVGAGAGLMLFSRAVVWLLQHHYKPTVMVITGVLMASLWVIWPFQARTYEIIHGKSHLLHSTPFLPHEWNSEVSAALAIMLAGIGLVFWLHALAGRRLRGK